MVITKDNLYPEITETLAQGTMQEVFKSGNDFLNYASRTNILDGLKIAPISVLKIEGARRFPTTDNDGENTMFFTTNIMSYLKLFEYRLSQFDASLRSFVLSGMHRDAVGTIARFQEERLEHDDDGEYSWEFTENIGV